MTVEEKDSDAISRAIRILSEAGYNVDQVGKANGTDDGVKFDLSVTAATKYRRFGPKSKAVREAAIEAQDFNSNGQPAKDGGSA